MIKRTIQQLMVASTLALLAACSVEHKESKSTYQFKENGCDTGTHEIDGGNQGATQEQLCATLQDGNANGGCAESFRRAEFERSCPGQTWNPRASAN